MLDRRTEIRSNSPSFSARFAGKLGEKSLNAIFLPILCVIAKIFLPHGYPVGTPLLFQGTDQERGGSFAGSIWRYMKFLFHPCNELCGLRNIVSRGLNFAHVISNIISKYFNTYLVSSLHFYPVLSRSIVLLSNAH